MIENDGAYTATKTYGFLWDAAYCPDVIPSGFNGCLVYAGGSSYSGVTSGIRPDGWDASDLARLPEGYHKLITWVPTPGRDNPREAARMFLSWLVRHNVPTHKENGGRYIRLLWDLETGVEPDPHFLNVAAGYMFSAGYFNLSYGSPDWAFGQPQRAGYITANPTGNPHIMAHDGEVGTQYAWNVLTPAGYRVDLDMVDEGLLPVLWH